MHVLHYIDKKVLNINIYLQNSKFRAFWSIFYGSMWTMDHRLWGNTNPQPMVHIIFDNIQQTVFLSLTADLYDYVRMQVVSF